MREDFDYRRDDSDGGEEVYSKVVRAGKRTYFFDVKETRGGDWFITLTESRKRTDRNGNPVFDKTKTHLYKEDFDKFAEGFQDALDFIKRERPQYFDADGRVIDNGGYPRAPKSEVDDEFDKL